MQAFFLLQQRREEGKHGGAITTGDKSSLPFLAAATPPPRLGYNEALCPRGRDTIFLNAPCAHFGVVWCAVGKFCSGDGMAGCS